MGMIFNFNHFSNAFTACIVSDSPMTIKIIKIRTLMGAFYLHTFIHHNKKHEVLPVYDQTTQIDISKSRLQALLCVPRPSFSLIANMTTRDSMEAVRGARVTTERQLLVNMKDDKIGTDTSTPDTSRRRS